MDFYSPFCDTPYLNQGVFSEKSAMIAPFRWFNTKLRLGWPLAWMMFCWLAISGCVADKTDIPVPDDSMSSFVRQARTQKDDIDRKCISDRANEIEANLGAR
jgi:hypothetical protein